MIDLYTATTPNGFKPAILLEELHLPYTVHSIDLKQKQQLEPDYLALNPNGKIPTIVDQETGVRVFESGAILIYLAEKTGQLIPQTLEGRIESTSWLMFQMANVGPMFGQLGHFVNSAPEPIPYAMRRYEEEANRLCQVMDRRLERQDYLAGEYSIADIATFPWIAVMEDLELELEDYPHLNRWFETIRQRPAVQKGMSILIG